jgi:hypothetical protein
MSAVGLPLGNAPGYAKGNALGNAQARHVDNARARNTGNARGTHRYAQGTSIARGGVELWVGPIGHLPIYGLGDHP